MQELNEALFLLINAPASPNVVLLAVAKVLADQAIWLAPMALIIGWFRGNERTRKLMLEATASGLAGLLINQVIGLFWQHPRPFMMGLGNTFIPHVADSSFPSDHLTLLWSIAFSFLMHQRSRLAGMVLALLGLPVAWARIYLGVHFPLDMVGAALIAVSSAYFCFREERWFLDGLYRWTSVVYRQVFALPIRRGWVRP